VPIEWLDNDSSQIDQLNPMEELQDAIEDAQYMNAVHDDSPKPSKPWKFKEKAALDAFVDNIRATRPQSMTLEAICASPSGFYLVSRH
jgi:hypothetical protein